MRRSSLELPQNTEIASAKNASYMLQLRSSMQAQ